MWSDSGVETYRELVTPTLLSLQQNWANPQSEVSFSILLQCTNEALINAAKSTNKIVDLTKEIKQKKTFVPAEVSSAANAKLKAHKIWLRTSEDQLSSDAAKTEAKLNFCQARANHRKLWRRHLSLQASDQDSRIHCILGKDPRKAFKELKALKSTSSTKVCELKVGDETFLDDKVADGFFHSVQKLKTMDSETEECSHCDNIRFDYDLILEISKHGNKIPRITLQKAEELLHSLRPNVCDHFNVTALHYVNGGPHAIQHFQTLINSAIDNIETTSCQEMNDAHAIVLYKGHMKNRTLASSYRTISSCPFLAKCLDFYVRELSIEEWNQEKAETQFLGSNMSHELGALLLTETITHSLKVNNQPVFCLFLDARSAFDLTIREIIVRKLHLLGTSGSRLLYIDNRLKYRRTFLEWDRKVLGPIVDQRGFEQGGISSGDLYTVYNSEQLTTAQDAGLGIQVDNVEVSAIGQADDVVLLSYDLFLLKNLLQLTLDYCGKHHVTLAPEKTKLMVFAPKQHKHLVNYQKAVTSLSINDTTINFTDVAEHVGVIRSTDGNLPHIQNRVTSHIKALFSVLPAGLSRNRNANPAVSLRIQSTFANPVLLSGVAPLILSNPETSILHSHHKNTLRNLQKLHKNTPDCFTLFMAGSPGATATLHMKQLGLFGMISRLPDNILHSIALSKLYSEPDDSCSWFVQIRHLCSKYALPSPLLVLSNPPTKSTFKALVKKKVIDFWQNQLRDEASTDNRPSLKYFKPQYMSLLKPHPLWTTSQANPFEINKSLVVAKLLSGQYRSDWHTRHWSKDNKEGFCLLCPGSEVPGTIEHMLISCPTLEDKRVLLFKYWNQQSEDNFHLQKLLESKLLSDATNLVQFLLDPSAVSSVISGCQQNHYTLNDVFALTKTFCYGIHRRRLKLLGRFHLWS